MSRLTALITACFVLLLLFVFPPGRAAAQATSLSGFSFMNLEPSARAAALGGSFAEGMSDDVSIFLYNPALLYPAADRGLSLTYLNHLSDVNAGFLAYAGRLDGVGTIGGALRFLSWGEMDERTEQNEQIGTFGATQAALSFGLSRPVSERISVGASLHGIYSGIAGYRASALAADAGVAYTVPEQQLTLSAVVANAGVVLSSLGATDDKLPLDVRVAVSKRLRYVPLMISLTGYDLQNVDTRVVDGPPLADVIGHVIVAGEFQFSEAFQVRLGYNHRRHEMFKMKSRLDTAGLSVGAGLKLARVRVDYALASWSDAGRLHTFSVRTKI